MDSILNKIMYYDCFIENIIIDISYKNIYTYFDYYFKLRIYMF